MTGQTDIDRETRLAVEALVYRLRNRGDADDEPFAAEFIAALKARGWRPTAAVPSPHWRVQGDSHIPDTSRSGGAEYLAVKAEMAAKAQANPRTPGATASGRTEKEHHRDE